MNDTFKLVYAMTDRVMGWYGFTHESDYALLPEAARVATYLVGLGYVPDRLTGTDIDVADEETGGNMRAMFDAVR